MALRKIREQGDEILRKKSREVNIDDITAEKNQSLIDDMLETMYHFNGVGLAAVQVGILKQIIVIDVDDENGIFSVSLIPHTLENITLGDKKTGDMVNIETDLFGKYVEKILKFENFDRYDNNEKEENKKSAITMEFLHKNGF